MSGPERAAKIIAVLVPLLVICFYNLYMGTFFGRSKRYRWQFPVWGIYLIWHLIGKGALPNVIGNIVLTSLIVCLAYEGKLLEQIIFNLLFNVIWMVTEIFFGLALKDIGIGAQYKYLLGATGSMAVFFLMIWGIHSTYKKADIVVRLSFGDKAGLILLPCGSLVIIQCLFRLVFQTHTGRSMLLLAVVSVIIVLSMNVFIFGIIIKLSEDIEVRRNNTLYVQQIELLENQHRAMQQNLAQVRELRHEIKHNMLLVNTWMDQENYGEVRKITDSYLEVLQHPESQIANSGNNTVDSIINYWGESAGEQKVDFHAELTVPADHLPFRGSDLYLIIGNGLSNAIEATCKLAEADRQIRIRLICESGNLFMEIRNTFNGNLISDGRNGYETTKSDRSNHGIGLHTIQKVTETYNGAMRIKADGDTFVLKTVLYQTEEKLHEEQ